MPPRSVQVWRREYREGELNICLSKHNYKSNFRVQSPGWRSTDLGDAKVQDLVHQLVDQHKVVFDAELAELTAEVRPEQVHHLQEADQIPP